MSDAVINLLLIEDNPADARLLREILSDVKTMRFKMTHADHLAAGIDLLGQGGVDLILLDLSLPDAQGLDTFLTILPHAPEVPTVVLTGLNDETLAIKAVQSGAQDYLVKGFVDGTLLARSLVYAIERKRAELRIQHHLQRITALRELNLAITSTLDLNLVVDLLLEKIDSLLHYPAATIRLRNHKTGKLEPVACRNIGEEAWKSETSAEGEGFTKTVLDHRSPVIFPNLGTDPRINDSSFFLEQALVSCAALPLVTSGETWGVLSLYTRKERRFTEEETEFLGTLAGQVSVALHNARLYEQIRDQARELEKANRMKSEFLSIVSHELRTPLNVVLGYTEIIRNRVVGEINREQEEILEKAQRQSNHLLAMINSLLEATRIESGKVRVEYQTTDMATFFANLQSRYDLHSGQNVRLSWHCPSDLTAITTDPGMLSQILQNLVDNAIKFTPNGEIEISARVFHEPPSMDVTDSSIEGSRNLPGQWSEESKTMRDPVPVDSSKAAVEAMRWIEFKVRDTGIGISQDSLPFVFQMFRQLDSSLTRSYGGIGLGLYIVQIYTGLLGGKVIVESELGKGSTFTVRLPG